MAKAPDLHATLAVNRKQALAYAHNVGAKRVLTTMTDASQELAARLKSLDPRMKGSFTYTKLVQSLRQVSLVTRDVVGSLRSDTLELGDEAAQTAAEHTLEHLNKAERSYRGIVQPLPIDEAAMMDRARAGARASILRRITDGPDEGLEEGSGAAEGAEEGIFERYGRNTVDVFEKKLRTGVVAGKDWEEMRQDITGESPFLQGSPRFWGERIVRTEVMASYNKGSWETIRGADDELGDMVKVLVATFDDRTSWDSFAVHGQMRRPDEPFEWYDYRGRLLQYQAPPNRPNDRETVVPHRLSWPIPDGMRPLPSSAYIARWVAERHKGPPPPRARMTTITPGQRPQRAGSGQGG